MNSNLKINHQTNENECGLCVIKSLVDYYHQKDIRFDEILNRCNLSRNGLSIEQLEDLGLKFGLMLESYECDIDELFKLSKNKYFIVLIKQNDALHYVIAKIINKDKIAIYCSVLGNYELHRNDFIKIWTNIYINVEKTIISNDFKFNKKFDWTFINWKYLIMSNLVNIFVVFISIIASMFIKNLLSFALYDQIISNVIMLIISYLFVFALQIVLNYLNAIWRYKMTIKVYAKLQRRTLRIISNKKLEYFDKVDLIHSLNFDQHLYKITNFYYARLNQLVSDILLSISILTIMGINHYIFFLAMLGSLIISFLIQWIKNKIINPLANELELKQCEYDNLMLKYVNFIRTNKYEEKNNLFLKKIYEKFQINLDVGNNFFNKIQLVNNLEAATNLVVYLLLIIVNITLIFKQYISIDIFILNLSLMQMFNQSTKNINAIFYEYNLLKINKKIINDIWNTENQPTFDGINPIKQIECISNGKLNLYNDTHIKGKNGIGKSTLLKTIANLIKPEAQVIKFNDINQALINTNWIKNNIVYINDDYQFSENDIIDLYHNQEYIEIINKIINQMQLNSINPQNMSLGQIQIINFLSLLNMKHKIILLDESLNHVDQNNKKILLQEIKPLIIKNNFLLYVDHELNQSKHKYFNHEVNLDA